MAPATNNDGSEDVADFLERIRELGDRKNREDEERTRKLEAEILEGRRARQARREERARSISPTKDSSLASSPTTSSTQPTSTSRSNLYASPKPDLSPTKAHAAPAMVIGDLSKGPEPQSPDKPPELESAPPLPPAHSPGLARSGTLSWQQRPGSKGSTEAPLKTPDNRTAGEDLGNKRTEETGGSPSRRPLSAQFQDSDFLRSTAERAKRSEAYRQSKDQSQFSASGLQSLRETSSPEKPMAEPSSPTKGKTVIDPPPMGSPTKTTAFSSDPLSPATRSPLPMTPSQRFSAHGSGETSPSRNPEQPFMSPTQARMSRGLDPRPVSPTKGLGGFVQSAMMKRADSLTRRDSARGRRPLSVAGSTAGQDAEGLSRSRPSSPEKSSILRKDGVFESPTKPSISSPSKPTGEPDVMSIEASKPKLEPEESKPQPKEKPTLKAKPLSGAKQHDQPKSVPSPKNDKFASPQAKPESSGRPAWMEELSRKKAARGSAESSKTASQRGGSMDKSGTTGLGGVGEAAEASSSGQASGAKGGHAPKLSESARFSTSSPSPRSSQLKPSDMASSSVAQSSSLTSKASPSANRSVGTETAVPSRATPAPPPPKIDFRANLKSRQDSTAKAATEAAEFQDVFGRLKKTETKNYVAPDELKDNILRGKSGLALTGGPKKTERVDDFKESILARKKEMQAGGGSIRGNPGSGADQETTPAASSSGFASSSKPAVMPSGGVGKDAPKPVPETKPQGFSGFSSRSSPMKSASSDAKGPESAKSAIVEGKKPAASTTVTTEKTMPSKSATAPAASPAPGAEPKGSLAGRFNPALAGLLAQRPSPASEQAGFSTSPTKTSAPSTLGQSSESAGESKPLEHATKSRARGPKRRPPTAAVREAKASVLETPRAEKLPVKIDRDEKRSPTFPKSTSAPSLGSKPSPVAAQIGKEVAAAAKAQSPAKPVVSPKPMSPKPPSSKPDVASGIDDVAGAASSSKVAAAGKQDHVVKPWSAAKTDGSAKSEAATKPKPASSKPAALSPRSPPMSPKSPNIVSNKSPPSGVQSSESAVPGLGISGAKAIPRSISGTLEAAPGKAHSEPGKAPKSPRSPRVPPKDADKPVKSPRSPPVPVKDSEKLARIASNSSLTLQDVPTTPKATEKTKEAKLIEQCFKDVPNVPFNTDLGTQAILAAYPKPNKLRTVRMEIHEITGDGKKTSVPARHQYMLFEKNMYLCLHIFDTEAGKRTTEVYLWCGDGVSSSAVDDAQLFGRNAAKEAGAKLTIVTQGKESANFIQALGDILIVRHGAADKASAAYMLRGRRHLGQIAFDEVALTPTALCAGFPHIVATASGKLYLWKGAGANADELGCARLMGMDLGKSGEIEEVDQGREPATFWAAFQSSERPAPAAEHWSQKAANDKYRTRLFAVGDARPKSASSYLWGKLPGTPTSDSSAAGIREIAPYSQADLSRDGIFVLDTYFEIFVTVGASASAKYQAFRTALFFGQEYGILAASLEDRPRVPVGTVVLAGVPAAVRDAFRKWDDIVSPTRAGKDGEGVVTMGLGAALETAGLDR